MLDACLLRVVVGLLDGDFPGVLVVDLVADEEGHSVVAGVPPDFLHPVLDVVEGLLPRDVVHEEDQLAVPVEYFVQRFVRLLPSCVPNLELNDFVFYLQQEGAEFDSNGDFVIVLELVFSQPHQDRTFAHACTKDEIRYLI